MTWLLGAALWAILVLLILILLKLSVAVDNLELLRHDLREAAGYGRKQ
jgi:hypothetical protein